MRSKKISTQLLKGYFLIAFLIITLVTTVYTAYSMYTESQLEKSDIDMHKFIKDYKLDRNGAFSNQNFQADDFIIITDYTYNVVDSFNTELPLNKDLYAFEETTSLVNYAYYLFDDEESHLIFHLYLSPYSENSASILIFFMIAIIIFIFIAFIYAHMTSKKIIQPLEKLRIGVQAISDGDYNHSIVFETNTELDYIKDEINHMRKQLAQEINNREQLEKERNNLILSLSHDIKTPLTNIIGYSEAISKRPLPQQTLNDIETIYRYGLIAAELTDELFDYAKIDNFNYIETEIMDIVEVTRVKLIDYINEFEHLNIDYNFDLPNSVILCRINVLMYYRVIDNLLQNAIKYNASNFSITISIETIDQNIVIIVQDNGCGIPIEYHTTIFNPMVRVENSRNRKLGGTGLGLSIAKNIITKHNGSIYLDSKYSDGCRFIIQIPQNDQVN